MIRIMFNSEKGGTGKTSLSTLYAAYRAIRGDRVIVVDLDMQAHATISFNIEPQPGLYNALVRGASLESQLITPASEAWIPEGKHAAGELYVLPGNSESAAITSTVDDPDALAALLSQAEAYADVVIIDTPPAGGMLLALAWQAVDHVVIPVQLEALSMHGLMGTIRRASRSRVQLAAIVPNMMQQTVLHNYYAEELREAASAQGWHVLPPIGRRIEWAESSSMRQMIYGIEGSMSKARAEAIEFCTHLTRQLERYHA